MVVGRGRLAEREVEVEGVWGVVVDVAAAEGDGGEHLRGLRAAVRSWMLCFLPWGGLGLLLRRDLGSCGRSSALGGGDRVVDDSSDQDRRFMCVEEVRVARSEVVCNC